MKSGKSFTAALLVLASTLWASSAFGTLITNGDFEADATGWTLTDNVRVVGTLGDPLWFGGGTAAQNGTRVAVFNSHDLIPNGTISQTFSTTLGGTYTVSFDFGVTGVFATDSQKIDFSVLGSDGLTVLFTQQITGVNPPVELATFAFSFSADGPLSTIRFADWGSNNSISQDGILDNVSVVRVPEPTSLILLGTGLFGLALMRRRRAA